jgi:hypothetical protein
MIGDRPSDSSGVSEQDMPLSEVDLRFYRDRMRIEREIAEIVAGLAKKLAAGEVEGEA